MNLTLLSETTHDARLPRLLSVFLHASIITLALIQRPTAPKRFPKGLIHVALYAPSRLILPAEAMAGGGGGGGGGGRHALAPASLGKLPRAADKQLVPPEPEPPKAVDAALIVEPSIVAPQLVSLPQLKLLTIGDPDGIPGPPSPGRGSRSRRTTRWRVFRATAARPGRNRRRRASSHSGPGSCRTRCRPRRGPAPHTCTWWTPPLSCRCIRCRRPW